MEKKEKWLTIAGLWKERKTEEKKTDESREVIYFF